MTKELQMQEDKMVAKKEKYAISVLIAEDEPDILEQLVGLVRRYVQNVYGAKDGEEALKLFHNKDIDLIVSDVDMPLMNGVELLKHIRVESSSDIPFILSTGLKSLDVVSDAIEYGVTAFLPKPLQKQNLLKQLQNIAQNKELQIGFEETQSILHQYQYAIDESSIVSKTDRDGNITYVNDLFCKLSGYSREELIGKSHNIIRHESMSTDIFKDLWDTIEAKKIWYGTIKNRTKKGDTYTVRSTIVPILDTAGNIIEYIAMREDITQEIAQDKAIKNERRKLYKVLNNMENIVAMSNENSQLLFTNDKLFEIFDYKNLEDFLKEKSCLCDLFEKEEGYLQKEMGGETWSQYVLKNSELSHKALMTDKHGLRRTFAVQVTKIKDEDEFFYLLTLNDISEVDKLREEAEQMAQAKGEFLANMSHEIRTPMNGILGFTKLLEKTTLDDKQKHYLDIIDGSTNTLLGIINDILDFSKLQSGKFELDMTQVNPFVEFEKTAMIFMARAKEKQIKFSVDMDPNISECIRTDLLRIQQVVSNLIGNALKFTPENGKILLHLKMLDRVESEMQLRIGVRDSGIGISKENQKNIFEAFSQADGSITRNFGGTGLGLSISAHLVSLMGGSLQVESEEGFGSDFFFDIVVKTCENENSLSKLFGNVKVNIISRLEDVNRDREKVLIYLDTMNIHYKVYPSDNIPDILNDNEIYILFCDSDEKLLQRFIDNNIKTIVACDEIKNYKIAKNVTLLNEIEDNFSVFYNVLLEIGMSYYKDSESHISRENNENKSYKNSILVAEDNEVNQILIREMLLLYGLEPVIVINGQEAVQEVSKNEYDLIFMDVNMPVMGGVEALHIIKGNGILTPIVALTANAMEGDKEKFMQEGFDNYLTKPIVVEELENTLDTYLQHNEHVPPAIDSKSSESTSSLHQHVNMELIHSKLSFPDRVLHMLFKSFLETYPKYIDSLQSGISDLDFDTIEHEAHALKGAAGNLRIEIVEELTANIERASREKKEIDYEHSFNELKTVLKEVRVELEEILNGNS